MVSRENNKAVVQEKLQLLRSITHSHSMNNTSIIADATKYIEDLKQKVDRLNHDISAAQSSNPRNQSSTVTVETLEKGFLVNVVIERNCPGLLVSILEVFEQLSLTVLEARVSCTDSFRLQAVGGEGDEHNESIDAEVVKQSVLQAIKNWTDTTNAEVDQE